MKVAKKQRANRSEENISTSEVQPTKRGGRTRRGKRTKLEEEKEKTTPDLSQDDSVVVVDDLLSGEDTVIKGEFKNVMTRYLMS